MSDLPISRNRHYKPIHERYKTNSGRMHHMIYCGACPEKRQRVSIGDKYCRECGAPIDWSLPEVSDHDPDYRDNPKYEDGHSFTVTICKKCGEYYEAFYEHICKRKNSWPIKEKKE